MIEPRPSDVSRIARADLWFAWDSISICGWTPSPTLQATGGPSAAVGLRRCLHRYSEAPGAHEAITGRPETFTSTANPHYFYDPMNGRSCPQYPGRAEQGLAARQGIFDANTAVRRRNRQNAPVAWEKNWRRTRADPSSPTTKAPSTSCAVSGCTTSDSWNRKPAFRRPPRTSRPDQPNEGAEATSPSSLSRSIPGGFPTYRKGNGGQIPDRSLFRWLDGNSHLLRPDRPLGQTVTETPCVELARSERQNSALSPTGDRKCR